MMYPLGIASSVPPWNNNKYDYAEPMYNSTASMGSLRISYYTRARVPLSGE